MFWVEFYYTKSEATRGAGEMYGNGKYVFELGI